jgi:hypothetical protein
MRYPSYLISCSHSRPWGGASTTLQRYGLPHFGRLLFDPATVGISARRRLNDLPGGGTRTIRVM